MDRILACVLMLAAGPALAQQPAPPRMLVPPEVRPGEVAPDPGITVPERILPAPPGHGAEVLMPPAASRGATPEQALVPPGGGDPGILAPPPAPKPASPEQGR